MGYGNTTDSPHFDIYYEQENDGHYGESVGWYVDFMDSKHEPKGYSSDDRHQDGWCGPFKTRAEAEAFAKAQVGET